MSDTKPTLGQAIDTIISALEGLDQEARNTAVAAACAHLNVKLSPQMQGQGSAAYPAVQAEAGVHHQPQQHHGKKVDIRSLKEEKNPDSAKQMACIVAYYLQELAPESERKKTVSAQDIEKYFKQANFKLPKIVAQVLVDAKKSGYFETAARGEYKLNAVGYNLVAHGLPAKKSS